MSVNSSGTGRNWIDPDDAPELSEDWFNRAKIRIGERVVRRGGFWPVAASTLLAPTRKYGHLLGPI